MKQLIHSIGLSNEICGFSGWFGNCSHDVFVWAKNKFVNVWEEKDEYCFVMWKWHEIWMSVCSFIGTKPCSWKFMSPVGPFLLPGSTEWLPSKLLGGPQSLKYLLSGPLRQIMPWLRTHIILWGVIVLNYLACWKRKSYILVNGRGCSLHPIALLNDAWLFLLTEISNKAVLLWPL